MALNVYLLNYRNADYDDLRSLVVVAANVKAARNLAAMEAGRTHEKKGRWYSGPETTCKKVMLNIPQVVLTESREA